MLCGFKCKATTSPISARNCSARAAGSILYPTEQERKSHKTGNATFVQGRTAANLGHASNNPLAPKAGRPGKRNHTITQQLVPGIRSSARAQPTWAWRPLPGGTRKQYRTLTQHTVGRAVQSKEQVWRLWLGAREPAAHGCNLPRVAEGETPACTSASTQDNSCWQAASHIIAWV